MAEQRHFTVGILEDLPAGEYPVHVDNIYQTDEGGYLWDLAFAEGGKILAAAPFLAAVGTDINEKSGELQRMRGVKVPLPRRLAGLVQMEHAMLMPVKKLLYSRECVLEVAEREADADPDHPTVVHIVTRTSEASETSA